MIATETGVTTITTESIGTGTETATIGEFIETAMTEDMDGTGATIAETMATTGAGTDGGGFTGTAATGFTKF
jgi:hypothetical protein